MSEGSGSIKQGILTELMKRGLKRPGKLLAYLASRHRGDLIELMEQSEDHVSLCLSYFTGPLLGIPQRIGDFCILNNDYKKSMWSTQD